MGNFPWHCRVFRESLKFMRENFPAKVHPPDHLSICLGPNTPKTILFSKIRLFCLHFRKVVDILKARAKKPRSRRTRPPENTWKYLFLCIFSRKVFQQSGSEFIFSTENRKKIGKILEKITENIIKILRISSRFWIWWKICENCEVNQWKLNFKNFLERKSEKIQK